MALVTEVYRITEEFPKSELFGLVSQIRRAAVSIPSNIAEGAGRSYDKEFIQFLYIALGSIAELETQFIIANNLAYVNMDLFNQINEKITLVRSQLLGLINFLKNKNRNETTR